MHSVTFAIALGAGSAGLALTAQIKDTAGARSRRRRRPFPIEFVKPSRLLNPPFEFIGADAAPASRPGIVLDEAAVEIEAQVNLRQFNPYVGTDQKQKLVSCGRRNSPAIADLPSDGVAPSAVNVAAKQLTEPQQDSLVRVSDCGAQAEVTSRAALVSQQRHAPFAVKEPRCISKIRALGGDSNQQSSIAVPCRGEAIQLAATDVGHSASETLVGRDLNPRCRLQIPPRSGQFQSGVGHVQIGGCGRPGKPLAGSNSGSARLEKCLDLTSSQEKSLVAVLDRPRSCFTGDFIEQAAPGETINRYRRTVKSDGRFRQCNPFILDACKFGVQAGMSF